MPKHTRKLIMRCQHPTPCDLCLTDCKRAEVTAKENEIRSDLLDFTKQWAGHNDSCDCLDEGSPRTDCTCGYDKARDKALAKATGLIAAAPELPDRFFDPEDEPRVSGLH